MLAENQGGGKQTMSGGPRLRPLSLERHSVRTSVVLFSGSGHSQIAMHYRCSRLAPEIDRRWITYIRLGAWSRRQTCL
jgi:hypothetical protein